MLSLSNSAYLQEKFFSYGITLIIILILSAPNVANAYLVLGYAHFSMTALYQLKSGRIGLKKLLLYFISFVLIFITSRYIPGYFTLFVSAFLLVHVFTGEVRHMNKKISIPYILLTVVLIVILCSWLVIELFGPVINMKYVLYGLTPLVVGAVYFFIKKYEFELFFFTLLFLVVFFASLEILNLRPTSFESFGFIVIAHYLTVYFNVFKSFKLKNPVRAKIFVFESFGMNMLVFTSYILIFYIFGTKNIVYEIFFNPISFYVWTLMHFLTTMDFKYYHTSVYEFLNRGSDTKYKQMTTVS